MIRLLGLILFPLFLISSAHTDEIRDKEIDHLLNFVASSKVTFIRNGKPHTPADAVGHMKKKYRRFKTKAKTAEDFIRNAATKSSVSGKPYQIKTADGKTLASGQWLLDELTRFRGTN